jgi:hypothetical protein
MSSAVHFLKGHGYDTWSLTWREDHKLRVFENQVLRGIFGPNMRLEKIAR